jgi:hypothetical protein
VEVQLHAFWTPTLVSFTPQSHDPWESVFPGTPCYIFQFLTVPIITCPFSSSIDTQQTTGNARWNVDTIQHTRHKLMCKSQIFFIRHSWPTYGMRAQNDTRHSTLSQTTVPYSAQHVYIHTYLTPYRLYMNYCCYQIMLQ